MELVFQGLPFWTYQTRGATYTTGADGLIFNPQVNDINDLYASGVVALPNYSGSATPENP